MIDLVANPSNEAWQECAVEFCGGTHLVSCEGAGNFIILHEQALASGTRRITAITGVPAKAAQDAGLSLLQQIIDAESLDGQALCDSYDELSKLVDELTLSQQSKHAARASLQKILTRVKEMQKQSASSRRDVVLEQARVIAESDQNIVVASIDGGDKDSMMTALDAVRSKRPDGAAILFTADQEEGKVIIVAGVSGALIGQGLKAGDWVREAAKVCGGGGGGRPDTAQAGGKNPEKVPAAMEGAIVFANEAIK